MVEIDVDPFLGFPFVFDSTAAYECSNAQMVPSPQPSLSLQSDSFPETFTIPDLLPEQDEFFAFASQWQHDAKFPTLMTH